jgi:acylphosphatase
LKHGTASGIAIPHAGIDPAHSRKLSDPTKGLSMANDPLVRISVRYSGDVQGVGFRMTAIDQLRGATIVGWVKNEADGSVQLQAEGRQIAVDRFLQRIRTAMVDRIKDEQITKCKPLENESTFSIRY